MIIINARLRDQNGYFDIFIKDNIIKDIRKKDNLLNITEKNKYKIYKKNETKNIIKLLKKTYNDIGEYIHDDIIDASNLLIIPPFCEPHIHLDTTMSAGEPRWNKSGTLFEGIECWALRKEKLTFSDVKKRARKALSWHIARGVQHVRTHVDTTDKNLTAVKALLEVKKEIKDYVDLQLVAFPQEGIYSYPNSKELIEESLKLGVDCIGAIPHFEFTREYGVESINYIFKLMEKYNKLIDVHCDEIDDEQSRFIEVLATRAYELGVGKKVTASHTTAMHSYNNAYAYKLFRLLKMSQINFVANPLVNIHLQGRFDSFPKRRGITRVKEMLEADINVCFGHDDIFDPWYPLGTADMVEVLHMGVHLTQMMGYDDLNKALDLITYNSAKTLNLGDDYGIKKGNKANLIFINALNSYDIIRRHKKCLLSLKEGKIISTSKEEESTIYIDNEAKSISFE